MELKISEYQLPELISFNYEEVKQWAIEGTELYQKLIFSDEQMGELKKKKAEFNKVRKALNDERIRLEREYMQPFNDFKKKVSEVIEIIDKTVAFMGKQQKEYEEQQKQKKHCEIAEYWRTVTQADEKFPSEITLERVFNEKWLNASVSMKSIQEEINSRLEQIKNDLETLSKLPEFGFEATEVYKTTLDINKALNEGRRLSEIQKRKTEHEAEQARLKAEAEARKQEEALQPVTPMGQDIASTERQYFEAAMNPPVEEKLDKMWISFKALLTTEDALALKQFFESRNIQFEKI